MSYTQIATSTLSAQAANITFSSIPQTFRDLVVSLEARGTSGAMIELRFNGSTGTYRIVATTYNGVGSTLSANTTSSTALETSASIDNLLSTDFGSHTFDIFEYSSTAKRKIALTRGSATTSSSRVFYQGAGYWDSNSAITTLLIKPTSGSFIAGTTATLYGVSA